MTNYSARQKRQCVHCAAGLPMYSPYSKHHSELRAQVERLEAALRQVRHSHNAHVIDAALADAAPAEQEVPNA